MSVYKVMRPVKKKKKPAQLAGAVKYANYVSTEE